MFCVVIGGKPRQGKSNTAKAMVAGKKAITRPCAVYDPRGEYGPYYWTLINGVRHQVPGPGLPLYKPGLKRFRFMGTPESFLEIVCAKDANGEFVLKDYNILIEEAYGFLKGNIPENLRDAIIGRFHPNNNWIFVFHKLATIPKDIVDFSNMVILFKTADVAKEVHKRFDDECIDAGFAIMKKQPDKSKPAYIDRNEETIIFAGKKLAVSQIKIDLND